MNTNGKYIQWCVLLVIYYSLRYCILLSALSWQHTFISNGEYCNTRKFLHTINFCYFRKSGKSMKIKSLWHFYFSNDIEENCHWIVNINWVKTFGCANQWKCILAKCSHFTVYKRLSEKFQYILLTITHFVLIFIYDCLQ